MSRPDETNIEKDVEELSSDDYPVQRQMSLLELMDLQSRIERGD